jgi:hypothetical protein
MSWEYMFESAETENEARAILSRLDRDGWEALSCSRAGGIIELFLRRRCDQSAGRSLLEQTYENAIEAD